MIKKHKKKILLGLLLVFVLIQFKRIDKTQPETTGPDFLEKSKAPDDVAELMKAVCYDCHSNEPVYPWYSNIAPVSWWLQGHIENGRKKANFSNWMENSLVEQDSILVRSSRLVGLKWMPILTYKITHGDARLTLEQRERLQWWFDSNQSGRFLDKIEN